ncbi:MAG TPA: cytochrome oxidase subunit III [Bacteroidetes bacterium]|nr:cytochrome oxidase subunit III [Bacteroidota bacterium]
MDLTLKRHTTGRNKIHPYKFALWVGCATLLMMFAALTSAYIVRQAAGNWLEFALPAVFKMSTITIVVSSLTLQGAYVFFKKGKETGYKVLLVATFLLGLLFFVFQYQGWQALAAAGIPFTLHPAGDFVYVISWLHAAHVLGGLAILAVAMIHAFALPYKVTKRRKLRFELSLTYWHFIGFLWIYLFFFLSVYR